jgi:class 3 adenylate cyclase
LDFAAACQLALRSHNHDTGAHNAIRVGVSRGEVAIGAAGLHGLPLPQAARLCAAAQPSEILVSEAVCEQVSDNPSGTFGDARQVIAKGLDPFTARPLTWAATQR